MSLLEKFIEELKTEESKELKHFDHSFLGKVKHFCFMMHQEEFKPSNELKLELKRLIRRASEPMKVAITGQFSSGKSTFLNALLGKNILPTGITPVTSKVNFIRYGEDYKIKVRFLDGKDEFYSLENLPNFTDQRQETASIEYLSIYAPLELLKEVVFVDTPGLNSQASVDTKTTKKVLREVDGIIWLSLMDNAGKMSEIKVLKAYMNSYAKKSLCVLNQKDKFSKDQIEKSLNYVKKTFGEFFSDIVAISALDALKARSNDRSHRLESLSINYQEKFRFASLLPSNFAKKELFEDSLQEFLNKAQKILNADTKANVQLLQSSNIQKVLDFIAKQIQPTATASKRYAISKEIHQISHELQEQHKSIIGIYQELYEILDLYDKNSALEFQELKEKFSHQAKDAYKSIENIIDKVADEIYKQVQTSTKVRYAKEKNFLGKESYKKLEYKLSRINADAVYKKLFYDDDVAGKMFKIFVKNLAKLQDEVNEANENIYKKLEKSVLAWQHPYELIRKQKPLHSDIEFASLRKFASKVYEDFLKSYDEHIRLSYAKISSEFTHLSSALNFNYQNATEVCVGFLERKIAQSVELYEEDPLRFPLYYPNPEEIKQRLRLSFHLYKFENLLYAKENFLDKHYDALAEHFSHIKEKKLELLRKKLSYHEHILAKLSELENMFKLENL